MHHFIPTIIFYTPGFYFYNVVSLPFSIRKSKPSFIHIPIIIIFLSLSPCFFRGLSHSYLRFSFLVLVSRIQIASGICCHPIYVELGSKFKLASDLLLFKRCNVHMYGLPCCESVAWKAVGALAKSHFCRNMPPSIHVYVRTLYNTCVACNITVTWCFINEGTEDEWSLKYIQSSASTLICMYICTTVCRWFAVFPDPGLVSQIMESFSSTKGQRGRCLTTI